MAVAPTEIRTLARSYTKAAINTLVGIMRQPKAPPAARVAAAIHLLDRGWGKAAQLVAVDGEIRQLVEVKLNVVTPNNLEQTTTKLLRLVLDIFPISTPVRLKLKASIEHG